MTTPVAALLRCDEGKEALTFLAIWRDEVARKSHVVVLGVGHTAALNAVVHSVEYLLSKGLAVRSSRTGYVDVPFQAIAVVWAAEELTRRHFRR